MTPPAPAEAFDVLIIAAAFLFLLAGAAWLADRKKDAPIPQQTRPDQHIPARERRPLGDDYRDLVAEYFGKVSRRRRIVREITRVDRV